MCGIALILSGACIRRPDQDRDSPTPLPVEVHEQKTISINDLKAVLHRRGPDSLGSKKAFFILQSHGGDEDHKYVESVIEGPCLKDAVSNGIVELHFIGAVLQLRGSSPVSQPLVDTFGNILVYNGEIFGGIHVDIDKNDGEALLHALERCCSCGCRGHENSCKCDLNESSVPHIFSNIRGPWSLIYWQARSKTLWFGRDAFGRRSLLVHWPTFDDPRFLLSSLSAPSLSRGASDSASCNVFESSGDFTSSDMEGSPCYWDELPCGIYSICFGTSMPNSQCAVEVRKNDWTDSLLKKLIQWERNFVDPRHDLQSHDPHCKAEKVPSLTIFDQAHCDACEEVDRVEKICRKYTGNLVSSMDSVSMSYSVEKLFLDVVHIEPAHKLLAALRESVMRRSTLSSSIQLGEIESAPVAVLFSGGLDSMILAALLDECLNPIYSIDLLNVSFDGMCAPDRISARAGVRELESISPSRRWRLVEIDSELSNLTSETEHVMTLINPAKTYMDLNIGIALWLAARGEGFVNDKLSNYEKECSHYKYCSNARILLVGAGADEQCAGYGRHRTKYKHGGWMALEEEMKLDMQRIWKRNLGRDDRCLSDHGKEARFPFLDENVIELLLEMPLWEIANLDEPVGRGDKKILREVAKLLGLDAAAGRPKRAIQFGSRIARESNKRNFGSNRAANQASAGSVVIGPGA